MSILLYQTNVSSLDYDRIRAMMERPDLSVDRHLMLLSRRSPRNLAESLAATTLLSHAVRDWTTGAYQHLPHPGDNPFEDADDEIALRSLPLSTLNLLPATWPVGAHGKPFPHGIETTRGIAHVSLSHSEGMVMVAVSDRPVGVDVQSTAALASTRWWRLDTRIRHATEEPAESAPDFARRWAAKEAALKASGEGLAGNMTRLHVQDDRVVCDDGGVFRLWRGLYNGFGVAVAGSTAP